MAVYYLDSSALVKAYAEEPGSDLVSSLISTWRIVVSALVVAEVASAVAKRVRERRLEAAGARLVFEMFADDLGHFDVIQVSERLIRAAAASLIQGHLPLLRASEAVHLATAEQSFILLREAADDECVFVVADHRLLAAAAAAGLRTEDPENHA